MMPDREVSTWIRHSPGRFTAGELRRRAGVERIGRFDLERMPDDEGPLFHSCGYLRSIHQDGRCPTESEARAAYGDR